MIEFIFGILESIGFTHPVHPAMTHIPMGMALGVITFGLVAFIFKQPVLYRTSYHLSILGLIGTPVTVFLGYLDWQYMYGGTYSIEIKIKLILALVLFILFILSAVYGKNAEKRPYLALLIYVLCACTAIGLGFTGGELIFG